MGDDTYTKEKKGSYIHTAHKDDDGRVPIGLPQINTSPMKKGHTDAELFSNPGYITQGRRYSYTGDPYVMKKSDARKPDNDKIQAIHEGAKFRGSGYKPEP